MAVLARNANRARAAAQREADSLSSILASTPEEAAGRTITAHDLLDHVAERPAISRENLLACPVTRLVISNSWR